MMRNSNWRRRATVLALVAGGLAASGCNNQECGDSIVGLFRLLHFNLLRVVETFQDDPDPDDQPGPLPPIERLPIPPEDDTVFVDLGAQVSIEGGLLAVGDPRLRIGGEEVGGVLFYRQVDDGYAQAGFEVGQFLGGAAEFGAAIDSGGGVVLVGAPGATAPLALPYRFREGENGEPGEVFGLGQLRPDPETFGAEGRFGEAVATDGEVFAIGAPGDGDGAVYVYEFDDQSEDFVQVQRIVGDESGQGDRFGAALAIEDGLLVVGAPDAADGGTRPGRAFVFERLPSGQWVRDRELRRRDFELTPANSDGSQFGADVAIGDGRIAISAPRQIIDLDPLANRGVVVVVEPGETDGPFFAPHTQDFSSNFHPATDVRFAGELLLASDNHLNTVRRLRRDENTGQWVVVDSVPYGGFSGAVAIDVEGALLAIGVPSDLSRNVLLQALPQDAPAKRAAKRGPALEPDRFYAFAAQEGATAPASGDLTTRTALHAPFRWEIAAGAFDSALTGDLRSGSFSLDLLGPDAGPERFFRLHAERSGGAWTVSGATESATLGAPVTVRADVLECALAHDGTSIVLEVRARGASAWRAVGTAPSGGLDRLLQRLFVAGIEPGTAIGVDDYRVTGGDAPVGEETLEDLLLAAGEAALRAGAELEGGLPDLVAARAPLARSLDRLEAARAAVADLPTPADKTTKKALKRLRKLVGKARKQAKQGLKKLDKGKAARTIAKKARKAAPLCGEALGNLDVVLAQ